MRSMHAGTAVRGRARARALATWLPAGVRHSFRAQQRRLRVHRVRTGTVEMGDLRRLRPISRAFGIDRGQSIARFYVERHLERHRSDIAGAVLEIGDDRYTRMFGAGRITRSDVLSVVDGAPGTTIVADLTRADHLPSEQYDCVICTQTLQMIYETHAAVASLHRLLRPSGVLLVTSSGISPIGRREGVDDWGEYWFASAQAMSKLLGERFSPANVQVETYGNVLTAIAYLHGLAAEELDSAELAYVDPDYEVIVGARAARSAPA